MTTGAKKRTKAQAANKNQKSGEADWSVVSASDDFVAPDDPANGGDRSARDTHDPEAGSSDDLVVNESGDVPHATTPTASISEGDDQSASPREVTIVDDAVEYQERVAAAEQPVENRPIPDDSAPTQRRMILGALFLLLSFDWLVVAAWIGWRARHALTAEEVVQWIPVLCLPLILLGIGWLIFGRTSRRETERFTRAITEMRNEGAALENMLLVVARRLDENHARVNEEAARLMSLGDEAADRLGRVAQYLSKESENLDRRSESLETAAASARVDIGVLLQDLPRAEEQARAVAQAMKDAGSGAHEQSGALEAQLSTLIMRGREASEVVGGAAQRLASHLDRIEATTASAASQMDGAATTLGAAIDGSMSRAAQAVDMARGGLQAQGDAMLAMIDQSRSALEQAGDQASRQLAERIEMLDTMIQQRRATLEQAGEEANRLLAERLQMLDTMIQQRRATLEQAGEEANRLLAERLQMLDTMIQQRRSTLEQAGEEASRLLSDQLDVVDNMIRERRASLEQSGDEASRLLIERLEAIDAMIQQRRDALEQAGHDASGLLSERLDVVDSMIQQRRTALEQAGEEASRLLTERLEAVDTLIAQRRLALEQAGDEASRQFTERLDMVGSKIEAVAAQLSRQNATSHELVSSLSNELDNLEQRYAHFAERGTSGTEALGSSIQTVRQAVDELSGELASGTDRAGGFIGRAQEMAQTVAALAQQLNTEIPAAFAVLEEQAVRTQASAASIGPSVDTMRTAASGAAEKVAEAEASLARQHETMDRLLERISDGLGAADEQLRSLGAAADEADNAVRKIVADTSPELVQSMLRVREAAQQAAERARETIAAVIPATAATLGDASREAVKDAVNAAVTEQLGSLSELAEKSMGAAKRASERLTRQMLSIGKTTAAIEARIEESQREREEQEAQSLSRTVALLIESLNSTAIDVTKLLSNEVTDSAWSSYLKGDRGVFTRRAVRLLSSGEARTIAKHYEDDPEFREHVNRYIHDFEAMLRRVLVDREGSPLGVTLLSSDMGKLYVALAQSIERLR